MSVQPEDVSPLEFVTCVFRAPTSSFGADVKVEFVVFHSSGGRNVAMPRDAEGLVWNGRPMALLDVGTGEHRVGVALISQGLFLVGCKVSDARSAWWVGNFVRIGSR